MLSRIFRVQPIKERGMINAALVADVPEQLGYIVKTGKVNKLVLAWIDFIHDNPHDGKIVYPQIRRLIAGFDDPMVQLRLTTKLFAVSKEKIDLRRFKKICKGLPRERTDEAYENLAKAFAKIGRYDNAARVANTNINGGKRRRNVLALINHLRGPDEFQRAMERRHKSIRPIPMQWARAI
jgi:hypothetical protein